jgi:hypothetical protein
MAQRGGEAPDERFYNPEQSPPTTVRLYNHDLPTPRYTPDEAVYLTETTHVDTKTRYPEPEDMDPATKALLEPKNYDYPRSTPSHPYARLEEEHDVLYQERGRLGERTPMLPARDTPGRRDYDPRVGTRDLNDERPWAPSSLFDSRAKAAHEDHFNSFWADQLRRKPGKRPSTRKNLSRIQLPKRT